MNIEHYLAGNHYSEIKVGQSGADVYEINKDLILTDFIPGPDLILEHWFRTQLNSALC